MNDATQTHVVCGHCDATVRVPAERLADKPRCPRCRQTLFSGHPVALRTATFDQHLTHNDVPVIVDFWAPWCGPCKMLAPVLDEIATEQGSRVKIAKVNVDENSVLANQYKIQGIPTLLYIANGEVRGQIVGVASKKAILAKLDTIGVPA